MFVDDPDLEALAATHLRRMARVLEGCDRHLASVRDLHGNKPATGSPVEWDVAEEHRLATPTLPHPVRDAFEIATLGLLAAADHLVVLAIAVGPPPRPFTPATLARQVMELSARSWYLADPGICPDRRAARFVTELLYTAWENQRNRMIMASGESPDDVVKAMLAWADQVGIETRTVGWGRREVGEDKRPRAKEVVRLMAGEPGAMGYHLYSATSHGTVGGLVDRLFSEGDHQQVGISVADVALVVASTLLRFFDGTGRLFDVFGWADDQTRQWRAHAIGVAREAGELTGVFDSD